MRNTVLLVFAMVAIAPDGSARGTARKGKKNRPAQIAPTEAQPKLAKKQEIPEFTIEGARIIVSDCLPSIEGAARTIDMGPSPTPGQSRLVSRGELESVLKRHAITDVPSDIPTLTRIKRAGKIVAPSEIAGVVEIDVQKNLKRGITLVRVESTHEVFVAKNATPQVAILPLFPHQKGPFRTSITVDFVDGSNTPVRTFVTAEFNISEEGATPEVPRNTHVNAVIRQHGLQIATSALTLSDASVGDVINVQLSTNKVVRAKLVSRDAADIL